MQQEDMSSCAVEACERSARTKGMCARHYTRWYRHGDPLHAAGSPNLEERVEFYINVDDESGCWIWTGTIRADGYGDTRANGRAQRAHRVVYELKVGPIPEGLELDHLCRNPPCVNPEHLEPVTHAENAGRSPILTSPSRADRLNSNEARLGHQAYYAAVTRLKDLHPEDFAQILQDERHKRGLDTDS